MKGDPRRRARKQQRQPNMRISREVKEAISRFIERTERIVQSVSPKASIVFPKSCGRGRKTRKDTKNKPEIALPPVDPKKWSRTQVIPIPQFRDDECYEANHRYRESVEGLLRSRNELQRIKGNRRSTYGIHKTRQTQANLQKNLEVLQMFIDPETAAEYRNEGVDLMQWPPGEPQNSLAVKFG